MLSGERGGFFKNETVKYFKLLCFLQITVNRFADCLVLVFTVLHCSAIFPDSAIIQNIPGITGGRGAQRKKIAKKGNGGFGELLLHK